MKKNFRFCILFILIFLFNTLIAKAEREVKKEDIELKNGEPDGWTYVYNEDGSLKREIFFVEGKVYEKDNKKK